jgi:D-tyrosyl-tRNA(Tyr) deacylase
MKLLIQRVSRAKVKVDDKTVGEIGKGYLVLLGIKKTDTEQEVKQCVDKLIKLRIMSDKDNKMNLSIKDANAQVLVVSQFTLYADLSKGNRPSFIKAADPLKALQLYELFVNTLKNLGVKVSTGRFGAYMVIDAKLDGPATVIVDK